MTIRGMSIMKSKKNRGYYLLFPRWRNENGEYVNAWELKHGDVKADRIYSKMCKLANQAMENLNTDNVMKMIL